VLHAAFVALTPSRWRLTLSCCLSFQSAAWQLICELLALQTSELAACVASASAASRRRQSQRQGRQPQPGAAQQQQQQQQQQYRGGPASAAPPPLLLSDAALEREFHVLRALIGEVNARFFVANRTPGLVIYLVRAPIITSAPCRRAAAVFCDCR
jgi:hypothetical protein